MRHLLSLFPGSLIFAKCCSALDSPQQDWSMYSCLVVTLVLKGSCTHLCRLFFSPVTSYSLTAQQCWCIPPQWHPVSYLRGEICPCLLSLNLSVWLNFLLLEKYPSSSKFSCVQGRKDDAFYSGNGRCVSWWGLIYRLMLSAHSMRGPWVLHYMQYKLQLLDAGDLGHRSRTGNVL